MATNDDVLTKSEFSEKIERYAVFNNVTLTQSIMDFCESYDIDFSDIPKMITEDLKEKIALCSNVYSSVYGDRNTLPI